MQTLRMITTEKKLRILEGLLFSSQEKVRVRAFAKTNAINPGYVSMFMKRMEKEGIMDKGMIRQDDPRVRSLKIVLNIDKVANAWKKIRIRGILGLGIFGSWAKGTNTENSDLDVWIRVDNELGAQETSEIRRILRDVTGVAEVSIISLTDEGVKEMKKRDPLFYSTLLNSYHIGGEQVDRP